MPSKLNGNADARNVFDKREIVSRIDAMTQDVAAQRCTDLTVPVSVRDHVQGLLDAPVVLVEYGDYECPDCLNAWPVVKELRERLQDQLAVVFRHFPQSGIHPRASAAAQAAEAAASQEKFWEMHDSLFRNQQKLADLDLTHLALQLGLEIYRFQTDYERASHLRRIQEDVESGSRSGVRGTPTFFINGCRYAGMKDLTSMLAAIEAARR
jgi:protein-disulfide isomerase